jgi:N-acetylglutamate synthase-like GNAT family acetyltransferase
MAISIRSFVPADEAAVIDLIVPIQRAEFGIDITADDQPDLSDIPAFYQTGQGDFWVAEADGHIVGTIALKDIGGDVGALRKMFVAADWRGREHGVAAGLLDRLIADARARGVRTILLGTTEAFAAAHRFYEKNGFVLVGEDALPPAFPRMAVDTRFYRLALVH